eukprot:PhM_4_TR17887/c0_g1_i1/m.58243
MSSEWTQDVVLAEEELNAKSKVMASLKAEYTHNTNKLSESYYPKVRPLHEQVYRSRKSQKYLNTEIEWKLKKLAALESSGLSKDVFDEVSALRAEREAVLRGPRGLFDESVKALNAVTKDDMALLRKYEHPPQCVLDAVESIYILRGDDDTFSWEDARVLLSDTYFLGFFLSKAKAFDATAISDAVMEKLTPRIESPDFEAGAVANASVPGGAIAMWVHALYDWATVDRILKPKRESIEEIRDAINMLRVTMQRKKDEVAGAESRLEAMQVELEQRQKDLKHRYDQAMQPLQEAFFEAHHHFTQQLHAASPTKKASEAAGDQQQ